MGCQRGSAIWCGQACNSIQNFETVQNNLLKCGRIRTAEDWCGLWVTVANSGAHVETRMMLGVDADCGELMTRKLWGMFRGVHSESGFERKQNAFLANWGHLRRDKFNVIVTELNTGSFSQTSRQIQNVVHAHKTELSMALQMFLKFSGTTTVFCEP